MNQSGNDGHYDVYWPRSPRQVKRTQLAPRLNTLEGKVVAQLWDFLFKGDQVFELLEEEIKTRVPGIRFVNWREFGNTHGNDEREVVAALPAKLKAMGVDAVISGIGA